MLRGPTLFFLAALLLATPCVLARSQRDTISSDLDNLEHDIKASLETSRLAKKVSSEDDKAVHPGAQAALAVSAKAKGCIPGKDCSNQPGDGGNLSPRDYSGGVDIEKIGDDSNLGSVLPRSCEKVAPYEEEIRDLAGVSQQHWTNFWKKAREDNQRIAMAKSKGFGRDMIKNSIPAKGGIPDLDSGDGSKSTKFAGPETEAVPARWCKEVPSQIHAYRTVVIERCLPDGATNKDLLIRKFYSPTPYSECEMEVKYRYHDEVDGRDTEAALIESHFDDKVYITFRATDKTSEWTQTNFKLNQKKMTVNGVSIGKVHVGFQRTFMAFTRHAWLGQRIREYTRKGKRIVFVGHSLGGALAQLGAIHTRLTHPSSTVDCITFGAPRVGDERFANVFNTEINESKRYVAVYKCNGKKYADPVPTVPPEGATQKLDYRGAFLATESKEGQGQRWDWWDRQKKKIKSGFRKAKNKAIDVTTKAAQRVVFSAVGALTSYKHVGGLQLLDVPVPEQSCKHHVDTFKMGMSVHGLYRRAILTFQLDEFLLDRIQESS